MKKKIITAVSLTVILSSGFLFCMRNYEDYKYEEKGNLLIKKIETYRRLKNSLPNSLTELGIEEPMNEGPYYEKIDSINYKVYFNVGFDNSKVYYSKLKEWRDEP